MLTHWKNYEQNVIMGCTEQYGSNEQYTLNELHTNQHAKTVIRSGEVLGLQAARIDCCKEQCNEE